MADADRPDGASRRDLTDEEAGLTLELTISGPGAQLPAASRDLRDYLPGLEPERHVTDWGRSERVEAVIDRTVYDFLYHHWFRVETEGIDNVPADGGALLVANHAGVLPPDGIMIAKAIREDHPRPRAVHLAVDRSFRTLPALGSLVTKIGAVTAHPANVHRLLFDEGQLVLAFPEGRSGPHKSLGERYRLRPFTHGGVVEAAMRARVPIIPIAVLGAEEAQPVFGRFGLLRGLTRLPVIPLTSPLPLPAKLKIRFLEPVPAGELAGEQLGRDKDLVRTLTDDIRALIQENLLEMVASRRSVWLG
jgi:1-acyl-sn-glycerol-3-phosphate acyltransferase